MKIQAEQFLSTKEKISTIQRYIIVHSILYYVMNKSVISDKKFDEVAKELVALKKQEQEAYKQSDYYYCMYDFDGSTGFDLYDRLNECDKEYLSFIAQAVLNNRGK